ncbi:hypothetical protein ABKN59_002260 [Abortiporus biennis]
MYCTDSLRVTGSSRENVPLEYYHIIRQSKYRSTPISDTFSVPNGFYSQCCVCMQAPWKTEATSLLQSKSSIFVAAMEPSHDVKAGFNIESRGFSEHSQSSEAQDDSRDQIPNGGANDIEFGISDSNESAQGDVYQEETKDTHEQEHLWKGLEGWSDLSRHLRQYDEERIKRVNDDMDTLLVFADTTWRSEDLYFYEDDHPFRDERWARENNSMNATCLASIDAMFMDDQYLSFIFVAARNMDFEDIVAIYRFIYSERKECLLRRKKLVLTYDFDSQHPDLHGVLGELFISVLQESYPKDEVITLFNMFLRQSPYSALLVVRICINPLVSKYDARGEFFNKIEVDSVSAIRHLIKAVSDEIASHPSARHKPDDDNDDNSPSRPPSLGDPIEETDNSVPIDPVNQLELLYYFTFSILARADEQLLTRFDTRKFLAQAVGQLRMLFSSSITSEDWELLEKRLLSRENTTPSQEYREAIDKLCTLLLTRIKEEAE